jgi:hypothetical protein
MKRETTKTNMVEHAIFAVLAPGVSRTRAIVKAAALMETAESTVYAWIDQGFVGRAKAAVKLSRATGVPVEKLAGE